jgi:hypothetical protein
MRIEMDLAMLHYVTFIEPFGVLPTGPCYSTPNNSRTTTPTRSLNKKSDPLVLLEEHFITAVVEYKKIYQIQFEDLWQEVVLFFLKYNFSGNFFA